MSKPRTHLKDTIEFYRKHPAIAWLLTVAPALMGLVIATLTDSPMVSNLALAAIVSIVTLDALRRYEAILVKRAAAENDGPELDVSVNGVIVGKMSDAKYAWIRRDAYFDSRLYLAQIGNLITCWLRAIDWLITALPGVAFWFAAGAYAFSPDAFSAAVASLHTALIAANGIHTKAVLTLISVMSGLAIVVCVFRAEKVGFVNHFDRIIGKQVRKVMKCAADGEIVVSRLIENKRVECDEMAFLRRRK